MKLNTFAPQKSRAQAMVEFAIVLPLLLLLVYGLIEAGRLLFMYSTIVTATRQASRYGSATGQGGDYTAAGGPNNSNVPRYQDCYGIRLAAQRVDFLNSFADSNITIEYDSGPGTGIDDTCDGDADTGVTPSDQNESRIAVTIDGNYFPIVPRIVPFLERSVANNNPIRATSARTIIIGIQIEVTSPPGSGVPTSGTSSLALTMTASQNTFAFAGETINFTYTLTNNGTADLSGLALTVTHGTLSCPGTTLAVGASMTCTGSYVTTAADVSAGSISAQATASGSDGTNPITSNTATVLLDWVEQPAITLTKSASSEYAPQGGTIVYTFVITNSGNVPLTGPTISDAQLGAPFACGGDLPPLASTSCTASYVVTAGDVGDNELVNSATASALYGTQTITSNTASVSVWTGPLFLRASVSPASVSAPGVVTYSYQLINNTGVILNPPYTISGHRGSENCSTNTSQIGIGGSITCTGTYTVTQGDLDGNASLGNNIRATACTPGPNCEGQRQVTSNTDPVSVTLVRTPGLSLAITSVTPNPATTLGTVVTLTYRVTNTGNVTLTPNVIDTKASGISCTPALGSSIGPGVSLTCTGTYTVTQADLDEGSFTGFTNANATFNNQLVSAVT
ncbi:MAG TPA: TadE/TadG family type IV pilus assembly protein, partial [Anaerolineales bacterium]|nr:TadE/TadG family type IV pilus assembly protein [Anaerolineales bacterium]